MPIRFHCETCEARVKVPGGSEGRKVKCPRCGQMQRVPLRAEQRVAVGVGADEPVGDDSGSFEAQTETEAHDSMHGGANEAAPARTTTKQAPRKGGLEVGDSLSDLAQALARDKDMTPPHVAARALDRPEAKATVRPIGALPRAVPLASSWSSKRQAQTPPSPAAAPPRQTTPYLALRNLATALRITPALLIPAVLWHILNAATLSGSIVTLIGGGAIVAMTWTLAEIADAVRDLAAID